MNTTKLIFSLTLYFGFVLLYTLGFHNIDTSINMKEYEMDLGFYREPYTYKETYMSGVLMLITGVMFNMLAFMLLVSEYIKRNNS